MGIGFDKVISDKKEIRIHRKLSGGWSVQFYKTVSIFVILPFYFIQPVSPNRGPQLSVGFPIVSMCGSDLPWIGLSKAFHRTYQQNQHHF